MKPRNVVGLFVLFGVVGLVVATLVIAQNQHIVRSFFPAPFGDYVDLTLDGVMKLNQRVQPGAVSGANEGLIYFDNVNKEFTVSEGGSPWGPLSSPDPAWSRNVAVSPPEVTLTNIGDRVGIGVNPPTAGYTFHLDGSFLVTDPGVPVRLDLSSNVGSAQTLKLRSNTAPFEWNFFQTSFPPNNFMVQSFDGVVFLAPVQIQPGTPTNSIHLTPTARVGIGTAFPTTTLDVVGTINASGDITGPPGTCCPDYVFEPDYELESIEAHAAFMWENKHLKGIPRPVVGEGGERQINIIETQWGILEELEKAHIYIEQLEKELTVLEAEMTALKGRERK